MISLCKAWQPMLFTATTSQQQVARIGAPFGVVLCSKSPTQIRHHLSSVSIGRSVCSHKWCEITPLQLANDYSKIDKTPNPLVTLTVLLECAISSALVATMKPATVATKQRTAIESSWSESRGTRSQNCLLQRSSWPKELPSQCRQSVRTCVPCGTIIFNILYIN